MTHSRLPLALDPAQLGPILQDDQIEQALATAELIPGFIGQDRAKSALAFAIGMDMPGYNLYVMGEPALGRFTLVQDILQHAAAEKATASEWCYLNNFDDERVPNTLRLLPGDGRILVKKLEALIDELLDTFPAAFDNPGYQRKKKSIARQFDDRYDQAIERVEKTALEKKVVLFEDNGAVSFSPIIDGKPLEDSEFSTMTDEQRQYFYSVVSELETVLNDALLELPRWKRELSENLRTLRKDTIEQAIKPMLKHMEHDYSTELGVLKYLKEMRPHLVKAVLELLPDESDAEKQEEIDSREIFVEEFVPNVLVHHETMSGAPIIFEPNPSYGNLFGRVEYNSSSGALYTNYRMIRPGALHKANGGYLILDADRLLSQASVWDALKLALKSGEVVIDTLSEHAVTNSTIITPRAIPLNVKVVLLGSRDLYYLVQEVDEEFNELFRVLADFEHYLPYNEQTLSYMSRQIQLQMQQLNINKLTQCGLRQLLQFSFRQAEHQRKLSARFADVLELVRESCYYAAQADSDILNENHVQQALQGKQHRTGRISEGFLEDIQEGQILIDTEGMAVGKINGLTVLEIGDTAFGTPARVSATVFAGSSGVIDIEREVELGKAIHSKGVLLLTGYLGAKYARNFPLTLCANIAMEQSYGHIDGDSASLAEVCALISAITDIPIEQSLAVTGSINQHGQVQAIGGVNEKIEGFFRLCQSRGLTGEQGVIIPASNQLNLVLRDEVIAAVAEQKFHIYVVKTVDEALALLTGEEAGELNRRGQYPKKSVNGRAMQRLAEIAELVNGALDE
ncbi:MULTISPECIES: Lon protease family protein [unclassified Arsukibacterium]|uniref:Lon protease family protein n=1 Tax=unclassified Arsukibacterium TaxID=2635278 RepID=UPI000C67DB8E|nr:MULTISPECIES: ATP-binding protein [unclassified Arsukibacterium]MAA94808.1 ATP-dependent protease [Rheinheimera sp.]MBM34535.1 ATP-dependent protease [Rheinheimera sp.]|tara:strand:- start:30796 stop:33186 length:2391 start_codon:yes stop_codon:yes gene_type:complete